MSVKLAFTLTLESDWHINAGYGLGSQIDAILERDSQGTPVISGSTLKGLFRDALYDLHTITNSSVAYKKPELGDTPKEVGLAGRVLGYHGIESRWTFSAAKPIIEQGGKEAGVDGTTIATGVRVDPAIRRAEANKFFTREMGMAQVFTFTIHNQEDADALADDVMWLVAAASYIRRLGGRRRRGAGRCTIQLSEDGNLHEALLENFGATYGNVGQVKPIQLPDDTWVNDSPDKTTAKRFRIWIHAKRPIVISNHHEAGNTYQGRMDIPGRTLRGALAYAVAPAKRDSADFRQLFVLSGLHFTDLHPLIRNKAYTALSIETPLGLQQQEDNPDKYRSVMVNDPIKTKGYKGRHLLADTYPSAKSLDNAKLQSETHMHVQIDPQTKRALEGNLYAYETPPSDLFYVGEVTLQEGVTWEQVAKLLGVHLEKPFDLSIGKGRRRSYGTSSAYIEELQNDEPPMWMPITLDKRLKANISQQDQIVTLTLASDAILMDTWGRYLQNFQTGDWLAKLLGVHDYEITREIVRTTVVKGFDMRAGLPHWQDIALVAGSSVTIQLNSGTWDLDKLQEIERDGIGLRRSEGYGRVVFNHPAHSGVIEGFKTLPIPPKLLPAEEQSIQKELPRSEFYKVWRIELEKTLASSYTGKEADTMQALSRLLVEHANDAELAHRVNAFGQSEHSNDKDPRLSDTAKQQINALIEKLDSQYRDHRRQGIILLAEALAQRSKS
jgi:CRISPR-associated protein Csx10